MVDVFEIHAHPILVWPEACSDDLAERFPQAFFELMVVKTLKLEQEWGRRG